MTRMNINISFESLLEHLKSQGLICHHQSPWKCQQELAPREVFAEHGYPPVSSAGKSLGADGPQQMWIVPHLSDADLVMNLYCNVDRAMSTVQMFPLQHTICLCEIFYPTYNFRHTDIQVCKNYKLMKKEFHMISITKSLDAKVVMMTSCYVIRLIYNMWELRIWSPNPTMHKVPSSPFPMRAGIEHEEGENKFESTPP